jgi:hypothetical protein
VLRDGSIATTAVATSTGTFSITLTNQSTGYLNFSLYGQDNDGNHSSLYAAPVTTTSGMTSTVSGIILSPTLHVSPYQVKRGGTVSFSGFAVPQGNITITLSGPQTFSTTIPSSPNGRYSLLFDSTGFPYGDYVVRSRSVLSGNRQSPDSLPASLTVATTTVATPARGVCGDYNFDGRVDLIDFSILVYWFDRNNPPPTVDCNHDNVIDLVDFSLLMYNWTG